MKILVNLILCFACLHATGQTHNPEEVYNIACKWAKEGKPDSAFRYLQMIVGKEYWKYGQLTGDSDLVSLHGDQRWQALLARIRGAKLAKLSLTGMYQDFDLMVAALHEAHTGLYWYNSKPAFDSMCQVQRGKIKRGLDVLGFYQVLAPVVAFTKEGHTFLRLGGEAQAYMQFSVKYFPWQVKFLQQVPYVKNGAVLKKINGEDVGAMMGRFLSYEPADGYNMTSKYRWIERNGRFASYYAYCYPGVDRFTIEVEEPGTGAKRIYKDIAAVPYDSIRKSVAEPPATLQIDSIAILTFNTFSSSRYKAAGMDFKAFVKQSFDTINSRHIPHLVIDVRRNGGGTEGYEDYLLSFLIDKDYQKYSYVQASAFHYSFYQYTDYKYDWEELEKMLAEEHVLQPDGRILRKDGVLAHELPQAAKYKGRLYVLTSGLTYSGGAEFAALVREHTDAVFVGEEVGGGYYGNTSGNRLVLRLPASKLEVGIPLLKFVVSTEKRQVPFGHGVIPDVEVVSGVEAYLKGTDVEMQQVREMLSK